MTIPPDFPLQAARELLELSKDGLPIYIELGHGRIARYQFKALTKAALIAQALVEAREREGRLRAALQHAKDVIHSMSAEDEPRDEHGDLVTWEAFSASHPLICGPINAALAQENEP